MDLLHPPDESEAALKARRRYLDFYSISRLRALTRHRVGTPHADLWHVFQFITRKLDSDTGCPELALPPLGSFLWTATQSTPDLLDSLISNRYFLEAVHALVFVRDGNVRRACQTQRRLPHQTRHSFHIHGATQTRAKLWWRKKLAPPS